MKKLNKLFALICAMLMLGGAAGAFAGCAGADKTVVLRVCSWEEYIDLGGWDKDEVIDLDSGDIFGENSMVDDFTEWFNDTHGYKIKVEYSTFGTNEDLYNRLSLGDTYDLVCPSDYMIMKLIDEGNYVEFSDGFWDTEREENYYARNVSRYIDGAEGEGIFNTFFENPADNWHKKAACYMWGTTGLVYNPEKIEADENKDIADVSTWNILLNENYKRQITIKDNVRDAYFATLGIINSGELRSESFSGDRSLILNDTSSQTIAKAENILKKIKNNVYSFETDAGKSDMVTGKVIANYQWSGDAVYILDEADGDEKNPVELWYSVPDECANLWFDGWLMLKSGVGENAQKREAAEAFVNFLSRPDNAVRNMYYIGYTSAIAGDTVFEYMEWNYGAGEDAEDTFEYDLSYFFGGGAKITADCADFEFADEEKKVINRGRQLFAQYPSANVIERSVVMLDFDYKKGSDEKLREINRMWINVRCLDAKDISPVTIGVIAGAAAALIIAVLLYAFRYKLFRKYKSKKGYRLIEE